MLSVRGLKLRPDGQPIDLEVKAGELIGLAGLEGHGGNLFLEALRGGVAAEGEVIRHLPEGEVAVGSPAEAADHDIAYVPRERRLDSLFSWMTIRENFAMPTVGRDTRFGWVRPGSSRAALPHTSSDWGSCSGPPSIRSRLCPAATSKK